MSNNVANILDEEEIENLQVSLVGAGLGGGFDHTNGLHVMKNEDAINWPDGEAWKWEGKNEHKEMIVHKVWVKKQVTKGTSILCSVWSMKMKMDGTVWGRFTAHGCSQKDGEHYDSSLIHAPIKMVW